MKKISFKGMSLGRLLMWLSIIGFCVAFMFYVTKGVGGLFNSIRW